MKYIANPVIVDAARIVSVHTGSVVLENGEIELVSPEMTARHWPQKGDYLVRQEDGYVYLNPKDVFERKYSPFLTAAREELDSSLAVTLRRWSLVLQNEGASAGRLAFLGAVIERVAALEEACRREADSVKV